MLDFDLPLIENTTRIENAFAPMIGRKVSGIVIKAPSGFRLLHFSQVRAAWEAGLKTMTEISGYVDLGDAPGTKLLKDMIPLEYILRKVAVSKELANVRSAMERGAAIYLSQSPGYMCNGKTPHFYPPQKRDESNNCVVLGCNGTIP